MKALAFRPHVGGLGVAVDSIHSANHTGINGDNYYIYEERN